MLILLSACASMPTQQSLKAGLQRTQAGISGGINRLKEKGSRLSDKSTEVAFRKYPLGQVPHTLIKKPVAEGRLTSGHGYRLSPTGVPTPKKHKGVDYAAPAGTPVYAAGDGVIEKIYVSDSYGNYIRIMHDNDFYTAYAHLQAFADGLEVGIPVSKGQIIGNVGSTGRSSGPHLHFELVHAGKFIDPLYVLKDEAVSDVAEN